MYKQFHTLHGTVFAGPHWYTTADGGHTWTPGHPGVGGSGISGQAVQPGGPVWLVWLVYGKSTSKTFGDATVFIPSPPRIRLQSPPGKILGDFATNLPPSNRRGLGFSTHADGWVLAGGLYLTGDGGRTWRPDPLQLPGLAGAAF